MIRTSENPIFHFTLSLGALELQQFKKQTIYLECISRSLFKYLFGRERIESDFRQCPRQLESTWNSALLHKISTQQHINTSTHQHIHTSTYPRINISTQQHIHISTHQHIHTSTYPRINISIQQHIHILTHQHINTNISTYPHINTSSYQHIHTCTYHHIHTSTY